ncbi:MAG: hypothetical protein ACM3X1_03265 [Ignavibacteriales bacterium]
MNSCNFPPCKESINRTLEKYPRGTLSNQTVGLIIVHLTRWRTYSKGQKKNQNLHASTKGYSSTTPMDRILYGGVITLYVNVAVTLQIDDRKVIVEDTSTN